MFDFLWHLRGSVRLESAWADQAVLDQIEKMLNQQRKSELQRDPTSIQFEDPLWNHFWQFTHRVTTMYDQGRFWIACGSNGHVLRYDLRSWQAFLFCLIGAMPVVVVASLVGDFQAGMKFGLLAFVWVYGMNLLIAVVSVPFMIRRTVKATSHLAEFYRPST